MKRIVVITHAGGSPYHGPNTRWYYLGKALKTFGVKVDIVSSSWFHKYISPPNVETPRVHRIIDGIDYHWIKTKRYKGRGITQVLNQLEFVFKCYRQLKFLAALKPDVVVASSPHPFVVFPAFSLARKAKAKLVYEVRDLWPEILVQLGSFSRSHPYVVALSIAERYAVARADLIVSVKPGDHSYFNERYDFPARKLAHIPNGFLDSPQSRQDAPKSLNELRSRYGCLVGYIGAISSYYCLENLLRLAETFRNRADVGYIVVGKGDKLESLVAMKLDLGLDNVHFVGAVPKLGVQESIAKFDICYLSLADVDVHKYGISCNKIFEYMAMGKPILGCYTVGHDPITLANCGLVLPSGDLDGLHDALESLVSDEKLRDFYGRNAEQYFLQNHDFRSIARKAVHVLFPGDD